MSGDPVLGKESLAKAVALVTSWLETGDGDNSAVAQTATAYLSEAAAARGSVEEVVEELTSLAAGLVSLSGMLVLTLAAKTKTTPEEWLQKLGRLAAD